ncbi:MAG: hypothetical protein ISQ97_00340 [Flavobacteriales bacterium]|nr:hypothetical protein [Flavobacteriales bacterium]
MSAMKIDIRSFLLACVVVSTSLCSSLWAQSEVDRATELGRSGNWTAAKQVLRPVLNTPAYQTNGRAWFVMGFIHKELHKSTGEFGSDAPERLEAITCLQRAMQLGMNPTDRAVAIEAMDFLSRSYFREAIGMVEGFTWGSTDEIKALYGRYEALEMSLNPTKDLAPQRSDLSRYLGQAHAMLLESESPRSSAELKAIFEAAIGHYGDALKGNPNDYAAQYNLAITLYNEGVRKLKRINHETSMFELMEIQDGCIDLFERALRPMQAAHAQQPNRLETLKGLMTLHYALSQKTASDAYRAQIEQILGNR